MKKQQQLGMNPSTASHRLVKDILFKLAVDSGHKCFQCGNELSRDSFSIEHKIPWLDSDDPSGLYFDIENIAFSHLRCNIQGARKRTVSGCGVNSVMYDKYGCRCDLCKESKSRDQAKNYTKDSRRERYLRTGK